MSAEDLLKELLETNNKYSDEKKEQATELVIKLATICRGYSPDVVLLVLESAMTEEITILSPVMGELFERSMQAYKEKATLLLTLTEALHARRNRTESEQ
jgi:hypothetical protein